MTKKKVLIGSGLVHTVQKFEHQDPAPHIPFEGSLPSRAESFFYGAAAILSFVSMLLVAYVLSTL